MFSYVAKSLLSKTLRTFLGKYLENIELESIDYGSASNAASSSASSGNSQNTSGSGWGVRLSNVKLREGMELVKLPGKRKRVVKRKRVKKVKRSKSKNSHPSNDSTPVTKNSKRPAELVEGGEESLAPPPLLSVGNGDITDDRSDTTCDDINRGHEGKSQRAMALHEKIQNRERSSTIDSELGYFSSSPSTPTQSGHGICGVQSCMSANSKRKLVSEEESAVGKCSLPYIGDQIGKGDIIFANNGKDTNESSCTEQREPSLDQSNKAKKGLLPSVPSAYDCDDQECLKEKSTVNDEYAEDDTFIEVEVEVEEEYVVEDDMSLVVGAGGVIGTLNIRLVGKELHVTVEDAHLIVEVISNEDASANKPKNDESTKSSQPPKPNLDRSTSSSSEADLSSLVDEGDGERLIGEKIKKKSMLARYLSMIPHLFLRDCRVSFILPEETGDDASSKDNCDDCTVFELGIDFLSVTSGDDFLGMLRFDHDQSPQGAQTPKSQPYGFRRSSSVTPNSNSEGKRPGKPKNQSTPNNIFERKRIRTGKGPDAGIWLKIHPPLGTMPSRVRHPSEHKWARQRFLDSSDYFFFRVSGIDLHARMLVDIKEDKVEKIGAAWGNEYEDYTMDSMLFGVDYIDPISITRHEMKKENKRLDQSYLDESSDVASCTDSNGIQSIPFASNCHWMAQRAHRGDCTNSHLPLNDCFFCWNKCMDQDSSSSMKNQMPLPGFVFCLSVTDPLEVNVDRSSLEALGYMKTLFTSSKPRTDEQNENDHHITDEDAHVIKKNPGQDDEAPSKQCSSWAFDDKSFPSFMQPDTIYLSGIYVAKLIVRVEAIGPKINRGLNFHFWEFVGQSLHFDQSQVDSEEQLSREMTFHVGRMECKDLIGACERRLLAAGIDLDGESYDNANVVYVPCTAARILGVSSQPLNKPCAVHLRLIRSTIQKKVLGHGSMSTTKVNYVNIQTGVVDVNIDDTLPGEIWKAWGDASSIFFSKSKKANKKVAEKSKANQQKDVSKWLFQISTKGGTLCYRPRIKMQIPEIDFRMRKGSEGFSFETLFQKLGIKYGNYMFAQPTRPSVMNLCALPESLRMHILLFLGDLTPLERVLNIRKKKSSAFLRSHAVNKKLTQHVKLRGTSEKERTHSEVSRRNNALSRLQTLDVDSLEALLVMHDKLLIK